MLYNNCKEIEPFSTIKTIRNIFNSLGILTKETWGENTINGIYSVRLQLMNSNLGTNGKGTTEVYALASAYAEMIERLSNNALFDSYAWNSCRNDLFAFFADEKYIHATDYLSDNIIADYFLAGLIDKNDYLSYDDKKLAVLKLNKNMKEKRIRLHNLETIFSKNEEFLSIPYRNLNNGQITYIPLFFRNVYGSNGMSAGNTYEEALVQALSEIFERYCMIKILNEKICPPVIDKGFIKINMPRIYDYMQQIEKKGNYLIQIRDCSLNQGFPVVCTCIYNLNTHKSITIFGAHPNIEIAIERTITEIFQGRSLDIGWIRFSENIIDKKFNTISLFKNSIGTFPDKFYSNAFSYNSNLSFYTFSSNKEMLMYYKNLCKEKKFEVFAKDNGNLGFPAVHIIIPGISEILNYNRLFLNSEIMIQKVPSVLNNTSKYSTQELSEALEFLDFARKVLLLNLSFSRLYKMTNNKKSNLPLLSLMIRKYYKMNNFKKASHLVKYIIDENIYEDNLDMWECLSNLFDIINRTNINNKKNYQILQKFYVQEILDQVENFLRTDDYIDINDREIINDKLKNVICNIKLSQYNWNKTKINNIKTW